MRHAVPVTVQTAAEAGDPLHVLIAFDQGSAAVHHADVVPLVDRLRSESTLVASITGYAPGPRGIEPPVGSPAARLGLSRALALKQSLVALGIPPRRIEMTRPGQGEDAVVVRMRMKTA